MAPPARPPDGRRRGRRRVLLGVLLAAVVAVGGVVWSRWGSPQGVTVEVPATRIWTDTGLRCEAGDELGITATGRASHERGSPRATVGPEGRDDPAYHPFNAGPGLETANHLAVIASVDQQPPFSVVGAGTTYTCERAGVLHLGVNDSGVDDNSGAFRAVVSRRDGS